MLLKISINSISKRYNYHWIFKNINGEINAHKHYVILGANGSGKSTFLKILLGYASASEGSIVWTKDDKIIAPEKYKNLYSFASPYMELIEEYSIDEMIKFYFSTWQKEINTDEYLSYFSLYDQRNTLISVASTGMKQRLKLAMALFAPSEIIFLDEPTSNLDSNGITLYQKRLHEIGFTKVVVIATNQTEDYLPESEILNIEDYK